MKLCLGCMMRLQDQEKVCSRCGYRVGTPVEEAYYLAPGTMLHGRYLLGKVLGYGGFGVTYIAWDTLLKNIAAIKEYFPSDFATRGTGSAKVTIYSGDAFEQFQAGLESFISEAKRLAQLNRIESIVHIYDYVLENDTGYIVMEYLSGKTVKEDLQSRGQYGWEEARRILICVLEALEEVHKLGIIHRDVAPDNIFLTDDGQIKLIDFGAARAAASSKSRSLSVILKPGYAPEEQYRTRGKQGPWTDVYGAGATLYRMLTGQKPEDSLERMVEDELQPPSALGVSLPKQMEAALMKSLAIRGEDRYQSARDFREALMRAEPSGEETAASGKATQAGLQDPRQGENNPHAKEESGSGEIEPKAWNAEDGDQAGKTREGTKKRIGGILCIAAILAVGCFTLLFSRASLRKNKRENGFAVESETESETGTEEATGEAESEPESETGTEEATSEAESESESETETEEVTSEAESESESESETETEEATGEAESESESETETEEAMSESESESESKNETETEEVTSEAESESKSEEETESETDPEEWSQYQVEKYDEPVTRYGLAVSGLNVRDIPDTSDGKVISHVTAGQEIQVYGTAKGPIGGQEGDWYLIQIDGEYGFISASDSYTTEDQAAAESAAAQSYSNSGSYSGSYSGGSSSGSSSGGGGYDWVVGSDDWDF